MSSPDEVKRMPLFWHNLKKAFIAIAVASMTIFLVLTAETTIQTHVPTDHLAKEVKVNPDVVVLAEYQRARTKKIPREIAEMQAQIIVEEAKKAEVPLALVVAVIEVESLFSPSLSSSAGAAGLMQILLEDGVNIDPDKQYDLRYNVSTGCQILKSKLKKSENNITQALTAYSGNAEGYAEKVFEKVGRFYLYKERTGFNGLALK